LRAFYCISTYNTTLARQFTCRLCIRYEDHHGCSSPAPLQSCAPPLCRRLLLLPRRCAMLKRGVRGRSSTRMCIVFRKCCIVTLADSSFAASTLPSFYSLPCPCRCARSLPPTLLLCPVSSTTSSSTTTNRNGSWTCRGRCRVIWSMSLGQRRRGLRRRLSRVLRVRRRRRRIV
jgi:hypothetical protein